MQIGCKLRNFFFVTLIFCKFSHNRGNVLAAICSCKVNPCTIHASLALVVVNALVQPGVNAMQLSFYTTLGVSQLLLQICNLHLGSSPCIHGPHHNSDILEPFRALECEQTWSKPQSQQHISPIGFLFWNFRHRLVRYYWYMYIPIWTCMNHLCGWCHWLKKAVIQGLQVFRSAWMSMCPSWLKSCTCASTHCPSKSDSIFFVRSES